MMKRLIWIIFLVGIIAGCDLEKAPTTEEELIEGLKEGVGEFQELAKPPTITAWVDNLKVKAHPGKDMPQVANLKEGEEAEYLYQRTVRKFDVELRGQKFRDSWYLIRTKDSVIGWVHGGGIRFVEFDINDVFAVNPDQPRSRGLDGNGEVPAPSVKQDWLLVPGKRVGPVTVNTPEESLPGLFGPGSVERGEVLAAGKKEPCTWVFKGTYDGLAFTWTDETRTRIKAVYLPNANGKWRLAEGLKPGISLDDLIKINEGPVSFYGFDWEYSGVISSWRNGKLEQYKDFFYVVLTYDKARSQQGVASIFKGDQVFSSNDPKLDGLEVKVGQVAIYLD